MALTYGFYDSLNHDRLYNAQQMSAIFDGIINDGVFASVGNQFHTVAGSGMQVIVKSGRAWFNSTWTLNDQEYPLSISAADVLLTRIDAVVLEVNSEQATRANSLKIVKGTPGSSPSKPTLTNTSTVHQHALAYITIPKNTSAITSSMIEIVVGKTETPYVTAILETTDITDLFNQWEGYFQDWFDNVRGTLDGDVALNLQNQITTLERNMLNPTTPPKIGLPSSATGNDMFLAFIDSPNLHLWEKQVVTQSPVEAYYDTTPVSGPSADTFFMMFGLGPNNAPRLSYGSSIKVSDSGLVTLISTGYIAGRNPGGSLSYYLSTSGTSITDIQTFLRGQYISINDNDTGGLYPIASYATLTDIYYVPEDATITIYSGSSTINASYSGTYINISKLEKVVGHPTVLGKSTKTYMISTDSSQYTEETDDPGLFVKKSDIIYEEMTFGSKTSSGTYISWYYSDYIVLSNTGEASLADQSSTNIRNDDSTTLTYAESFRGCYIKTIQDGSSFDVNKIYYIPNDAIIVRNIDSSVASFNTIRTNCYQTVEPLSFNTLYNYTRYLGKFGDSCRFGTDFYIGTGLYGSENQITLRFPFPIKFFWIIGVRQGTILYAPLVNESNASSPLIPMHLLTTEFQIGILNEGSSYSGSGVLIKKTLDNRSITWYIKTQRSNGFNTLNYMYEYIYIG